MKLKKRFFIIISIALTITAILSPALCEAQSIISRKKTPGKNQTESSTNKPKPTPTPKPKTQESSKPSSNSTIAKTKPSSSDTPKGSYGAPITINGHIVQWEWTCSGWCDGYDNKRDYSSYVIRGGSYELAPRYARNTNRRHAKPDVRAKSFGLRLVVQ